MSYRQKFIDIELSQPLPTLTGLGSYQQVQGLVRLWGEVLGWVWIPVRSGICSAAAIAEAIFPKYARPVSQKLLAQRLLRPTVGSWRVADWLDENGLLQDRSDRQTPASQPWPSLTVVVPVLPEEADRATEGLQFLQQAVQQAIATMPTAELTVIIVEITPCNDRLQSLIRTDYPSFRYRSTDNPSVNAARNLALQESQGEIVAFTTPLAQVDRAWLTTIVQSFIQHPNLSLLTGLVVPTCIEHDRDRRYEVGYSLERGHERRWFHWSANPPWPELGRMQMAAPMNFALRRSALSAIGNFDPALDLPKLTGLGCGVWELFCRGLLAGQTGLYEPALVVRYPLPETRREMARSAQQFGRSFFSYVTMGRRRYPDLKGRFFLLGCWKLTWILMLIVGGRYIPRLWKWAELRGAIGSWGSYDKALQQVAALPPTPLALQAPALSLTMAVREVDLAQPLPKVLEAPEAQAVRIFVKLGSRLIGSVDIAHDGQPMSPTRLAQAIAKQLTLELLALPYQSDTAQAWNRTQQAIADHWTPKGMTQIPQTAQRYDRLPQSMTVSVIIPTCDRPQDLVRCLQHVLSQNTDRPFEVIVVDNRPQSGITAPIVAQFPTVKYIPETRAGSSYARNTAITASTGDIVAMVDDDVVVPPDWLETLIAPMARPEVMVVTGNVLPLELATPAQVMFENLKGGLSPGFVPFEVDKRWLDSFEICAPPIWELGVSANAAFRSTIFSHPTIGLMDEVLGPGTPTLGGEENHLIYKVLRSGFTLVYEPDAYAWHHHRQSMQSLYRQTVGHMRGGMCYHILMWRQERDRRGFLQLFKEMPRYLTQRMCDRVLGRHQTPWGLLRSEIWGYLSSFWSYAQSKKRVQRIGRSQPYIPKDQRSTLLEADNSVQVQSTQLLSSQPSLPESPPG
ncbi:glycosyltransferase [Alkalinema pantanalense CENA528]|uniref:glycosyltransferase n=1 Tax=Alkalinema pantanalense TaxID=1620705 RepID=UPI003D6EED0F